MKKSRFTGEQIAYALKQAELGTTMGEICRKMGVAEATFHVWRKKYGGPGPSELKRLQLLEGKTASSSNWARSYFDNFLPTHGLCHYVL